MELHTTHRGADRPFERDRHLVLRAIPEGATIVSATATARPVSADANGRFLEAIDFNGSAGTWGAHQRVDGDWVEVDLRARRRLASVRGSNLASGRLLVDLGGGFGAVDALGGLGGDSEFPLLADDQELPGLTVTALRIADTPGGPGIERLEVASPPSNVTLSLEGGPAFWTHFGDLVEETTSPDFTDLLAEAMAGGDIENGHHVIGLVLHSDSLARIDLTLDVRYTTTASAAPDGVERVSLTYGYGSTPDTPGGGLSIALPRGSIAVPGSTAGRVQGSFASTRVVQGPVGRVALTATVEVGPTVSQAQRFRSAADEVITSIDILVTAITSTVEVSIDLVGDLDGKPDQVSLLPTAVERSITRDEAPEAAWINAPLPAEFELRAGAQYWLVIQARDGRMSWSRADDPAADRAGLQSTIDGGLSWRAVGGPGAAVFRLRHTTPTFRMPLELRVDAGGGEIPVDLSRFGSAGSIDFSLDFPEVADAVNRSLEAAGTAAVPTAEHLDNGDFERWYRSGSALNDGQVIDSFDDLAAGAFSPDGSTVYAVTSDRLESYGTLCAEPFASAAISFGRPTEMAVDPTGQIALVTSLHFDDDLEATIIARSNRNRFTGTLVELASARPIDEQILSEAFLVFLQPTADRSGLYALAAAPDGQVGLVRLSWTGLRAAARTGSLADADPLWLPLPNTLRGFAVDPAGEVWTVSTGGPGRIVVAGHDARLEPVGGGGTFSLEGDLSVPPVVQGGNLIVLSDSHLLVVDPRANRVVARHTLPAGSQGQQLVLDPDDGSVLVIVGTQILRLAAGGRSLTVASLTATAVAHFLMSPTANRLLRRQLTFQEHGLATEFSLIRIGADLPSDWELTGGQVDPGCGSEPPGALAVLGGTFVGDVPVESALSQVVPVDPATTYRFAFDAASSVVDATAQILWRSGDCGADRIDSVPIEVVPLVEGSWPPRLVHHEHVLQAPPGVVAAEVRFHTHDGAVAIDRVSLAGTTEATGNPTLTTTGGQVAGWAGVGASLALGTDEYGATTLLADGGDAALVQVVPVGGSRYRLDAVARVLSGTGEAAVVVDFLDDSGASLGGAPVRLQLSALTFDALVGQGGTPAGAADARLSLEVPAFVSLAVDRLALSFLEPVPVSLEFVSEAPGQLTISQPTVEVDIAPPSRPPVPENGLCRPTPPGAEPGADDCCYCPCCAQRVEVVEAAPVAVPGGRPAEMATCASCSGSVVVAGRTTTVSSQEPVVPRLRTYRLRSPTTPLARADGGPRLVSVELPITEINGIGAGLAARLAEQQINGIAELARARPAAVAAVAGISERQAIGFIDQAKRLVAERGRPVF